MNIKKIEEKNGVLKILVKGTNAAFMNSIRRTIMKDVPILAIENVSVYENSSVTFDEYFTHRLGLLPIKTDLKEYKIGDTLKLILEKEGPCTVYSRDIKSTDPDAEIITKKVPLLKLKKGQRVKVEMDAVMGTGADHVKWQPAIVSFYNVPEIESEKSCDACGECIKVCPKDVLEIKAKKVSLTDPYSCILCGECRDSCKNNAINLNYDEGSFVMVIEPTGSLSAAETLCEAADILNQKIKELRKSIKEA